MTTRDDLVRALSNASTLSDQIKIVAELDAYDAGVRQRTAMERSLDWAATTVAETMRPVTAYDRHSITSDWLAEAETAPQENYHQAVLAEAALWYGRTDADVKADAHEFMEQARGVMTRTAGRYGDAAEDAYRIGMEYLAFLNRQVLAASGLDQVQQRVDSFENPKETPLPTDVFDTFQPPIHPINQGVDGTQTNSLAPGAEMAMGENGGSPMGDPSHHDWSGMGVETAPNAGAIDGAPVTAPSHAGPPGEPSEHDESGMEDDERRTASLFGSPSVAIGYTGMNLDDYLAKEAAQRQEDRRPFGEAPHGEGVNKTAGFKDFNEVNDHLQNCDSCAAYDRNNGHPMDRLYNQVGEYGTEGLKNQLEKHIRKVHSSIREAASGLPQVQQEVDSFENPAPTSLPTDVMFPVVQPWEEMNSSQLLQQGGQDTGSSHRPHTGVHKQADQWLGGDEPHAVPGGETPVFNSPATTDQKASGDYSRGYTEGQQDARSGERPTFSDVSSGVSPYVRGYSEGFATAAPQPGQTTQPDVPYSMGGDSGQATNAGEVAARTEKPLQERPDLNMAAARTAKGDEGVSQQKREHAEEHGHTLPGTDKFPIENKQDLENAKHDVGRTNEPHDKVVRYINERADDLGAAKIGETDEGTKKASLTVSAALVTKDITDDRDFWVGYKVGRQWNTERLLPKSGSAGFEAGLYAGMTDNPLAQLDWVQRHQVQSAKHPELVTRMDTHHKVTAHYARINPEAMVRGLYVQAATSTDLDTMSPRSTPDPQGATPLMGPGTVPPLRGAPGSPAAPGGPSPFNGAEPMGAPVVDDPLIGQQTAQLPEPAQGVNLEGDSGLANATPKTLASLGPQALAFRKIVQANKLALRQKGN